VAKRSAAILFLAVAATAHADWAVLGMLFWKTTLAKPVGACGAIN